MTAAATNLETATRDLLIAWERAREQWRDARSQQFEHQFVTPLPELVIHARDAMGHTEALLRRIKNDCE